MPLGCIGWEIIWALRSKAQHWVIRRLRAIRNVSTHLEWCLRPTGTAFDDRQSWPSLGSRCPRSSPFWQTTAIHLCSSEGHAAFLCPSIQNLPPPPTHTHLPFHCAHRRYNSAELLHSSPPSSSPFTAPTKETTLWMLHAAGNLAPCAPPQLLLTRDF